MHVSFSVHAYHDDRSLTVAAENAKEAFAKAVEWHVVERFFDVSISDGNKRYSIVEFSSIMALAEIAHTVKTAAEARTMNYSGTGAHHPQFPTQETRLAGSTREKRVPSPAAVRVRESSSMHGSMLMTVDGIRCTRSATRRWTPDEESKLDELLDAGKDAADIAVALNRTRQAVYARLQRVYRRRSRLSGLSSSG